MRLHVGISAAKKLFSSLDGQVFHHVHALAAAVVSFSRVTFRVFVGQGASHSRHHGFAHPVFGCDQLDMGILTGDLILDRLGNFLIYCFYFL